MSAMYIAGLRWKNPDINNDGKVDLFDVAFVSARVNVAGADPRADLNWDGKVDKADLDFVSYYFGRLRPKDEDLPFIVQPLPELPEIPAPYVPPEPEPTPVGVYELRFTFTKLPWFNKSALEGAVRNLLVNPATVVLAPLGYLFQSTKSRYLDGQVQVSAYYSKPAGSSPIPIGLIWAGIGIAALVAIGVILKNVAWIYQTRVEEEKAFIYQDTANKLKEELDAGKITSDQYTALMSKLAESGILAKPTEGEDWMSMLTTALPLIIVIAIFGAVMGLMPKRKD